MMTRILPATWRGFALVGASGYVVATAVTLVDVIGRALGVTLIRGAIDVVIVCMVLAAAFAVALAEARDANVRVEPLSAWIPKRMRGGFDRFWRAVSAILFAAIAVRSVQEAVLAHSFGEVLPAIGVSTGVLGLLAAVGFGLGAIAAVALLVHRDPPAGAGEPQPLETTDGSA